MKKGMTLVEVVMATVIIAIAFYSLIAVYATTAQRNVTVETINDKLYLAQEKIEQYLTRPIASIVTVNPTTIESAGFSDYKYQILVTMVATSDLATTVASSPYKKISVLVWGGQPTNVMGTVEVDTLAVGW